MKKHIYLAMVMTEEIPVKLGDILGKKQLKLNWATGMIGAFPIFDNAKDAIEFTGNKGLVHKLEVEK